MLDCPFKESFSSSQPDGSYNPISTLEEFENYAHIPFLSITFSILDKDHIS